MAILTPTYDKLKMRPAGGGTPVIEFFKLSEPAVLPELEMELSRYEEHRTRPGRTLKGGLRTFSVLPASPNSGKLDFTAGFVQPADLAQIRVWQQTDPPLVQVTNGPLTPGGGSDTWFLVVLRTVRPFNYRFNHREFCGVEFALPVVNQV